MGLKSKPNKNPFYPFLAYLLASITGVIGIFLWFTIRDTLMVTLTYFSFNFWSRPAIDNFSFLLLGIGWLVLVYFSNHYYQKGLEEGSVLSKLFLITGIQFILFFVSKIILISIGFSPGFYNILVAIAVGVIGFGLIVFTRRKRNKSTSHGKLDVNP